MPSPDGNAREVLDWLRQLNRRELQSQYPAWREPRPLGADIGEKDPGEGSELAERSS